MNILFLSDIVPYPPNTGIKIRTFNIIKELFNNGNNVYLIAFNHRVFINTDSEKNRCISELEKICKIVKIFDIPSDINNIKKYSLYIKNLFTCKPYRVQRYFTSNCIDILTEWVKKYNLDICHMDKTEFYIYAKYIVNIPIYVTNHNVESDLMRQRASKEINIARKVFSYLQWKKTQSYEKYALERVSGYITCTEEDRIMIERKYNINTPAIVIENGVDCEYYKNQNCCDKTYFLIIGAQNKESTANYDATMYFLHYIWPLVKKENNSIELKIVGRNVDRKIIKLACLDPSIEIVGYVEDERPYISNARALIVPLRIGGGSRLKILTAFGMGKAVISTSKGAEGIAYTNNHNIVIADSPEEFARAILRLYWSKELAARYGHNARSLVESRYDWRYLGAKLDKFYRNQLVPVELVPGSETGV